MALTPENVGNPTNPPWFWHSLSPSGQLEPTYTLFRRHQYRPILAKNSGCGCGDLTMGITEPGYLQYPEVGIRSTEKIPKAPPVHQPWQLDIPRGPRIFTLLGFSIWVARCHGGPKIGCWDISPDSVRAGVSGVIIWCNVAGV